MALLTSRNNAISMQRTQNPAKAAQRKARRKATDPGKPALGWKAHAQRWLAEAEDIPNGEREERLEAYARDETHVTARTMRKYVQALAALKEIRKTAQPLLKDADHARLDAVLDDLSANEVRDLHSVRSYGTDHFHDVVGQVLAGLRKSRLKSAWAGLRPGLASQAVDEGPRNANKYRVTNRLNRPKALGAAAACLGAGPELVTILPDTFALAPFLVDAVIGDRARLGRLIGLRHLGDTGRPGLTSRMADAVAAALASARAFDGFYLVVQGTTDAEEAGRRLAAVEPCGVGVIRFDAPTGKATMLTTGRVRDARHGPDLAERLPALLKAARIEVE